MTPRPVALAIPAALLLAAVAMLALRGHAPPDLTAAYFEPLPVATNWHAFGALQLGVLLVAIALASAAYLRILRAANGPAEAGLRGPLSVAALAAIALACAWCAPLLFSSDVYAYAAYGELARLGADPYAHRVLPGGDALFAAAIVQWGNPPPACVYGLPFVWIARAAVTVFAPFGTLAQLNALRAIASAALPAAGALAYAAYPGTLAQRLRVSATLSLNPAAIWCAAEGHNDALAIALALGGYALARRGPRAAGAALAALAGAIKLPGLLAVLPLARTDRRAGVGAALGAAASLALSIPLLAGIANGLAPHARYAPEASLQAVAKTAALALAPEPVAAAVAWAIAAAAAAALLVPAVRLLRGGRAEGWAYAALAGWLLVPNPYPWYGTWLLAVAAAAPGTRAAAALIGLSIASLLRYVPDAVAAPGPAAAVALGIAALLPYALLVRTRRAPLL